MPNWCEFDLTISGTEEDINNFYETHKILSFKTDVPYEGEWDYHWCYENWGTKWDLNDCEGTLADDRKSIQYYSQTAWCPPEKWFKVMIAKYPNLSFVLKYEEPGMEFCGTLHEDGRDEYYQNSAYQEYRIEQMGIMDYLESCGLDHCVEGIPEDSVKNIYDTHEDVRDAVYNGDDEVLMELFQKYHTPASPIDTHKPTHT